MSYILTIYKKTGFGSSKNYWARKKIACLAMFKKKKCLITFCFQIYLYIDMFK